MRLYLSYEASQELESIEIYITEEQQTPIQAAGVMSRLYDSLDHISRNTHIGHITEYPNTFEYVVPGLPFIIIYRLLNNEIEVVTVFHTSRDENTKKMT